MRFIIFFSALCILISSTTSKKIVCYLGSWAVYRSGNGQFNIDDVDPHLCTHIIYAFVGIENNNVKIMDPWCDLPNGKNGYGKLQALRQKNPNVKLMVAVGGWNFGSVSFSQVAADNKRRKTFADNVVKFLEKHHFDGFDIDWEYPAQRGGAKEDIKNFVKLAADLKQALGNKYILSAAVAAGESSASQSYDIPAMSEYLDFINLMEYDFHGSWDGKTGLNAGLNSIGSDKLNVKASIDYWTSHGAPKEKLILGVPTYGRSFTLASPSNNGVGASTTGAGHPGPYTNEAGNLGYNEICEMQKQGGWNAQHDDTLGEAYASKGDQWVSYDNVNDAKAKAEFVQSLGLGGAMIWSLETDDFKGICGQKYPILGALNSILKNGGANKAPNIAIPIEHETISEEVVKSEKASVSFDVVAESPSKCQTIGDRYLNSKTCGFYTCIQGGGDGMITISTNCPEGLCFNDQIQACDYKR